MELHEREKMVKEIEWDIGDVIAEKTRELTTGEAIRVFCSLFNGQISTIAKYMIREERHGESDKPGGLA